MWFKSFDETENNQISDPTLNTKNSDNEYGYLCFKKDEVYLPKEGYFALSAMTGAFGDDHDIINMAVFKLLDSEMPNEHVYNQEILDKEKQQYDKIFKEREEKFKILIFLINLDINYYIKKI